MFIKTIFLVALIGGVQEVVANPQEVDSLIKVSANQSDSTQCNTYLKIAKEYYFLRDYQKCIEYSDKALKNAVAQNNLYNQTDAWDMLAKVAVAKRDYVKADSIFIITNKLIKVTRLGEDEMRQYTGLGNLAYYRNDLKLAAEMFIKALKKAEEINDLNGQSKTTNNIAFILNRLYQHDEAIKYRRQAYDISLLIGDKKQSIKVLSNLAVDYGFLEESDSVITYSTKALSLAKREGMHVEIIQNWNILAGAYLLKENYPKVVAYCDSTIHRADKQYDANALVSAFYKKSDALDFMGDTKAALSATDSVYKYARITGSKGHLKNALERYYEYHKKLGNFQSALSSYERLSIIKDSIFGIENSAVINELKEKYNNEKHLRKINELNQQAEIDQLNSFILSGCIVLAILIIVLLAAIYRAKIEREKVKRHKIVERLNRARINPHFIFNALTSIQNFILEGNDKSEAVLYLSKFSKIMRRVLESTYDDLVTIEEELTLITNYLDLQRARYKHRFDYEILLPDNLDQKEYLVPSMLAQPFLENSIEHGFKNLTTPGLVSLHLKQKGQHFEMTISDNGVGTKNAGDEKSDSEHKSRALSIISDRLKFVNRRSKNKVHFSIKDLKNEGASKGTEVSFKIPMISSYASINN